MEVSQLICFANQMTGFYMVRISTERCLQSYFSFSYLFITAIIKVSWECLKRVQLW